MKKQLLSILLASAMIFSLVGCNKQTTETAAEPAATQEDAAEDTEEPAEETATEAVEASGEPVTLRMAWWGSQTRHDRTIEVIEMYMKQNPNVTIEYEFYDYEGYFNKLNTLVASNEVWDVFQLGSNFPEYQDKIYNLNEFIEDGTIDVSGTTDEFLKITQDINGNQVGLSNGVNTYGIAYDPAMFEEAGVAEPTENWTWDDFATACRTIHEKMDIYGFSKMDDWQAGAVTSTAQTSKGVGFFKSDNSGVGFEDPPILADFIQMRCDLVKEGAFPDLGAEEEVTDIENDFLVTGEAAMTWVASNQFIALCEAAGRELKLINPPRKSADGPAGVNVQSSQMLCASSDGTNPAEAAKFIAFFESSVEANEILLGERGIPIFTDVRDALMAQMSDAEKSVYGYVDTVGNFESEWSNPSSPACTESIKETYDYNLAKAISGDITADEAAKAIYDFAATAEY